MKVCFSRCRVRTQVIISSRVHVSGTAAARAPGMGENTAEKFKFTCQMCEDFTHLNSPNSYSLNCVDCFPGACIFVSIETKGIHVLHCLLPSYNKVTLS